MSMRSSVVTSLLAWAASLAFGSWSAQIHSSPSETAGPRAPQVAETPTSFHLDAPALLEHAHALIENAEWLACEVRQKKQSCTISFVFFDFF